MKDTDLPNTTIYRRRMIMQILAELGEVYVSELSKKFLVSEVTIRNDLENLEKKNLLVRARGGAIMLENNTSISKHYGQRSREHFLQKSRIGKAAIEMLDNNDTIIIGPGTTTGEMARIIPEEIELTVITNAIPVIQHLIPKSKVNIIVPGGNLSKQSGILMGPITENGLRNFYVDKVFLGADGCDARRGIFTSNLEISQIMKLMISISREVVLLTDSSKFSKKSLTLMGSFDKIDVVITDDRISPEDRRIIEDHGARVIVV